MFGFPNRKVDDKAESDSVVAITSFIGVMSTAQSGDKMLAAQSAMHMRETLLKDGKPDPLSPVEANVEDSLYTTYLTMKIKEAGKDFCAAQKMGDDLYMLMADSKMVGYSIWLHTLNAVLFPKVHPYGVALWRELEQGRLQLPKDGLGELPVPAAMKAGY